MYNAKRYETEDHYQTPYAKKEPRVIVSALDVKSYAPDNGIIRGGLVQLNKINQYQTDLPDTARADLLVAPDNIKDIYGGDLGSWTSNIKGIRNLKDYHGLDGMQIFDSTERDLCSLEVLEVIYDLSEDEIEIPPSYEKQLAEHITAAFAKAQSTGKSVTTGFFMPTKQIVHGRQIYSPHESVANNLFSKRHEIFNDVAKISKYGAEPAHWEHTCTEHPEAGFSFVHSVSFDQGCLHYRP